MSRSNPPWRCAQCGERAVVPAIVEHRGQVKHENVLHEVYVRELPVNKCGHCGLVTAGVETDTKIRETLRDQLHLLKPSIIRKCRAAIGITQERFALVAGFASETLSRWENGQLPSRLSSNFMRVYFGIPQVRVFLDSLIEDRSLGEYVVWNDRSSSYYDTSTAAQAKAAQLAQIEGAEHPQERACGPPPGVAPLTHSCVRHVSESWFFE